MQKNMNTSHFGKILVVDDATANLQLLTNLLTEHGYTVYPASAGKLALEFLRLTLPDLILLDIRMPGMDGFEVCRRIKAVERTRSIPIMFISVLEDEGEKVKGFQEGAVDYITKPFQPEEVLARVSLHLRLRQLTDHLEHTVAERTEKLTIANQRLQEEIGERRQAEEEVRQNLAQQKALLYLYQNTDTLPVRDIISFVVNQCVKLTASVMGFVGLISDDDRQMEAHIWSEKAMEHCPINKPSAFPISGAGLWAEPIRQSRPIIVNDYRAPNPYKKGCPEGHLELSRFMGIPVVDQGRVVAVAGVANRREEYTESDCYKVSLLLEGMWDLIKRKRAEASVVNLKNYLANIIDSMPTILVGIDRHEIVTQWNRQAEVLTGISTAAAIGRPISHLLPDFSARIAALWRDIEQQQHAIMEQCVIEEEGECRFYDLMLYPLLTNGVEGAVIRIEDMTERTRIRALMIQTEKMMSVAGLAAGMAHEINNPLNIIIQAAQNIERRVSPELDANRQAAESLGLSLEQMQVYFAQRQIPKFLGSIHTSAFRGAKIIANMLRFSRRSEQMIQPALLADLLERAVELASSDYDLKKKYDFQNIAIVRDYASDLPEVMVVTVEIEQVLLNLLKNAAQAMGIDPQDRPPRIALRLRREDRYAVIEVEDNGPGMDETIRRRVFEPFFTTKEPGVGTGLGLSVSYMIITQNHKGLFEVASTPGNGACFTIRLPLTAHPRGDTS